MLLDVASWNVSITIGPVYTVPVLYCCTGIVGVNDLRKLVVTRSDEKKAIKVGIKRESNPIIGGDIAGPEMAMVDGIGGPQP